MLRRLCQCFLFVCVAIDTIGIETINSFTLGFTAPKSNNLLGVLFLIVKWANDFVFYIGLV